MPSQNIPVNLIKKISASDRQNDWRTFAFLELFSQLTILKWEDSVIWFSSVILEHHVLNTRICDHLDIRHIQNTRQNSDILLRNITWFIVFYHTSLDAISHHMILALSIQRIYRIGLSRNHTKWPTKNLDLWCSVAEIHVSGSWSSSCPSNSWVLIKSEFIINNLCYQSCWYMTL